MNVVQSGSYFAQTIQPGANWKTVAKFESASGLRCAWMNKIASLILNYNEMCEIPARSKALTIAIASSPHWGMFWFYFFIHITGKGLLQVHVRNEFSFTRRWFLCLW